MAYALQEAGMLLRFFTTLWYKPGQFPYSVFGGGEISRQFRKRYFDKINPALVEQIPWQELLLQAIRVFSKSVYGRHIYKVNRSFDREVASRLESLSFDLFIGYETSCLYSFEHCRKRGIKTLLDLAQVHHSAHQVLINSGIDPFHGDRDLETRINQAKDRELELADVILVPSNYSLRTLTDAGIAAEKIILLEYGYDPEIFGPVEMKQLNKTFRALFAGSITRRKGVDILLQAWAELNFDDAELILAGGPADATPLLNKSTHRIRYIPFVEARELASLYRQSDVFVLPSLMDSFGIVVLEAMACGTPVVVTSTTGASDLVRNGIDGFIISNDKEAIKEKLRFFYNNRDLSVEMGRSAAAQAQPYTWERYRKAIAAIVQRLCSRAGESMAVPV